MTIPFYFATSEENSGLTEDDLIAAGALSALGVDVRPLVWTRTLATSVDSAATVILRSVWDYHLRSSEFTRWISDLEKRGTRVLNPPDVVRWNLNKRYLADLAAAGVSIIPTVWLSRGAHTSLGSIMDREGWDHVVVKPTISASAYRTLRIGVDSDRAQSEDIFAELSAERDVMVQRYVSEITTAGEWALMFFEGQYSHAVLKRPADGDFRVQLALGGSVASEIPAASVISAAQHAVNRIPGGAPLYTRVDGVEVDGELLLMEAECIDPVLFFGFDELAASRFAECVARGALAA